MKIGIAGCTGKMGREITKEILHHSNNKFEISAASTDPNNDNIGKDIGIIAGVAPTGIKITSSPEGLVTLSDIIIDFTNPEASMAHAKLCVQHGKKYVCGTTGFADTDIRHLKEYAKKIPIFYSPNMSIGVNLLKKLAYISAKVLGDDFDIEVIEMHHNKKIDAPSGTALLLGQEIAKAFNIKLEEKATYSREKSKSERKKGEIGFAVLRGGDVAGDHSVIFAGTGEMITLSHRATSRSVFSKGAVKAAIWLSDKTPGKLYSMDDILV